MKRIFILKLLDQSIGGEFENTSFHHFFSKKEILQDFFSHRTPYKMGWLKEKKEKELYIIRGG